MTPYQAYMRANRERYEVDISKVNQLGEEQGRDAAKAYLRERQVSQNVVREEAIAFSYAAERK